MPRCKSNSGSNVTFFSLPIIKYTRLRWLKFLLHFNKIVERHEKVLICDNHFDRGQIVTNCSRIRLVPGTVPSWGLALDGSLIQVRTMMSSIAELMKFIFYNFFEIFKCS